MALTELKIKNLKPKDKLYRITDGGKNPMREKQIEKLRITKEGENTFERVTRHWFELKQKGLDEKYCKQNLARMEQYVFPKIGALPISDITIPDVVTLLKLLSNTAR